MRQTVIAPREILKRAYLARGSATLAPLKPTSLVTFLFGDKKVTTYKRKPGNGSPFPGCFLFCGIGHFLQQLPDGELLGADILALAALDALGSLGEAIGIIAYFPERIMKNFCKI